MSEEKTLALNYYRDECGRAYTQYRKTKELYEAHKHEWEYWRSRYEALDRELALTDGRLRICPCGKKEKVPAKPPELTKEQLLAIAEKLGIEIKEPDQEKFIIIEEEDEKDGEDEIRS
jgi:hypothetical protein